MVKRKSRSVCIAFIMAMLLGLTTCVLGAVWARADETPVEMNSFITNSSKLKWGFATPNVTSDSLIVAHDINNATLFFDGEELTNQYIELSMKLSNVGSWNSMVLLRDSRPGYLYFERTGEAATTTNCYNVAIDGTAVQLKIIKNGAQVGDTKELGTINLTANQTINLKYQVEDNSNGEPVIKVFNGDTLVGQYVDAAKTIMAGGGFTVGFNSSYVENDVKKIATITKFNANFTVTDDKPNDSAKLYNLIKYDYILDSNYGKVKQNNTVIIDNVTGNNGTVFYDEEVIKNQYIDLSLSLAHLDNWDMMIHLRDNTPGSLFFDREGSTANCYNVIFDDSSVIIRIMKNSAQVGTDIILGNIDAFAAKETFSMRLEIEDNANGEPVIKIFQDGKIKGKYVDTAKNITEGGGFTIGFNSGAKVGDERKSATISCLEANVVFREEEGINPDEPENNYEQTMIDVIEAPNSINKMYDVNYTEDSIKLNGAAHSADGSLSFVYGNTTAVTQVLEIDVTPASLSIYDIPSKKDIPSDWYGGFFLRDSDPGKTHFDSQRSGNGAYYLMLDATNFTFYSLNAGGAMVQISSNVLPADFWEKDDKLVKHTFRFEVIDIEQGDGVLVKVFIDGKYTYRIVDRTETRKTGSVKGFGVMTKVAWSLNEFKANVTRVQPLPPINLTDVPAIDFTDLAADSHDWAGQFRTGQPTGTKFVPSGIELLEGSIKNAGFVKENTTYKDFHLDFKFRVDMMENYKKENWVTMMTFRDTNPTYHTFDTANKNAYILLFFIVPEGVPGKNGSILLRSTKNAAGQVSAQPTLATVSNIDLQSDRTMKLVCYDDTAGNVRIALYIDGVLMLDFLDKGETAPGKINDAGSFMLVTQGLEENTALPITSKVSFTGLKEGDPSREYFIGMEPRPADAKPYPENKFDELALGGKEEEGCNSSVLFGGGYSCLLILAAAMGFVVIKRRKSA